MYISVQNLIEELMQETEKYQLELPTHYSKVTTALLSCTMYNGRIENTRQSYK